MEEKRRSLKRPVFWFFFFTTFFQLWVALLLWTNRISGKVTSCSPELYYPWPDSSIKKTESSLLLISVTAGVVQVWATQLPSYPIKHPNIKHPSENNPKNTLKWSLSHLNWEPTPPPFSRHLQLMLSFIRTVLSKRSRVGRRVWQLQPPPPSALLPSSSNSRDFVNPQLLEQTWRKISSWTMQIELRHHDKA